MAHTGGPARQRGRILTIATLAVAASGVAAALIVADQRVAGAVAALVSGSALLLSGIRSAETADAGSRFADSLAERFVDAIVIGTLAWVATPESPGVSAAALTALVSSYIASYLRTKALGLGFRVDEALWLRSARISFVALGILGDSAPALLVATAISLQAIIVRTAAVARQKESR
jgi:hypothetical protein